jgi:uncharacterized protein (DUF2147 family)
MKKILLLAVATLVMSSVWSQSSPAGVWKTIDDSTGEAKSHVEIYEQDGKYFGKVTKILTENRDAVCEECSGDRKNAPVLGMVIIEDLKPYQDYWKKGMILDPEDGSEYGCTVWYEEGKPDELKVRGIHWTGLYRTQTWHKVK